MIAEAAARLGSFADAAYSLHLAGVEISSRHVHRMAVALGCELIQDRDCKVALHRDNKLPVFVKTIPEVVAVEVDGGRLRTRAANCGPGVHDKQNKEDKIACLATLQSKVHQDDPQPEPPQSFLLPRRVQRLVKQIQGKSVGRAQDETGKEDTATDEHPIQEKSEGEDAPKKLVRTCVASMANSHSFGPMVAAEAQQRGFYQAKRRAFVGDGAAYNWEIQRAEFAEFEPIADFLHVLCYVYAAAWVIGSDDKNRWSVYVQWLTACWQGQVKKVIQEMQTWQSRTETLDNALPVEAQDLRKWVAEALTYLGNNQDRMDYPHYRKLGLPVTSSLAESLVGEFNARVKGNEKFWNRSTDCEAILQLRAAYLSEDDRLTRYFAQRPGNPFRRAAKLKKTI
jgi:hypothetical protein